MTGQVYRSRGTDVPSQVSVDNFIAPAQIP